jgi:endoglucanase
MREESKAFFQAIMEAPSPSGFETPVQAIVREYAGRFADEISTDVHGNVIAVRNPGAPVRVMLAGHCDQIGFMIRHIEETGVLRIAAIGGIDPKVISGHTVTVHTENGPVNGVIGRKAIHLMTSKERQSGKVKIEDLWIDIGAEDREAAEEMVSIGDVATFQLNYTPLHGDLVAAPGCDDKVGVFVAMEALRQIPADELDCAVYAVSTVQEELGLRGARTSAFSIDPHAGIAIDVTHATDYPGVEAKKAGDITIGKGPALPKGANINARLRTILTGAAQAQGIEYQNEPTPRATGTDANVIQITRAGVAAALIGIPNRYMHTAVEIVSLSDLQDAATLLAAALTRIDEETDFIPM